MSGNPRNRSAQVESLEPRQLLSGGSVGGTIVSSGGGLAGITVYLDANNNSQLDTGELSTTTTATGAYKIIDVPAGAYIVRQIPSAGDTQVNPANNYGIHITVTSGAALTGENFTDTAADGRINGTITTATGGVGNITVYLDANNDNQLDNNELSTTTNANGAYAFANVPAGAYIVRQILPSGGAQTTPANGYGIHVSLAGGATLTNQNFIDTLTGRGSVSGVITDGTLQIVGQTVYLDANNNGQLDPGELSTTTGGSVYGYVFNNVLPGDYIIRQLGVDTDNQTTPGDGLGIHITITAGANLTGENFIDTPTGGINPVITGATVSGDVTTAADVPISGVTIYLDANNDSKLDDGERSTTTDANGDYYFGNVTAGAYIIRQTLTLLERQDTPASGYGIHITAVNNTFLYNETFVDSYIIVHPLATPTQIASPNPIASSTFAPAAADQPTLIDALLDLW